jgi:hypothetical protein
VTGEPSPPRRPCTIRRTSTVDITCDDAGSQLVLDGSARDLATTRDMRSRVLATARTRIIVDVASGTVTSIDEEPGQGGRTARLVGLPSGSGFRRALSRELPDVTNDGSLLGLLLDEVPVAVVIAGSLLRRRAGEKAVRTAGSSVVRPAPRPVAHGVARPLRPNPPVDVCAGWARGGLLARAVEETGRPPLSEGPEVSPLASPGDPDAWHPLSPMPAWSMRRARRIDVSFPASPGEPYEIDSLFRDSRVTDDDGSERGVHEYAIRATVDAAGTISAIEAIPRVLPAPECPAAAMSSHRLVGMPLAELRAHVSAAFTGTSTCTHLNDALRALGDLDVLIGTGFEQDGQARHG